MMHRERQADFDRWASELDYRCENRPLIFAFHRDYDDGKVLTTRESKIVQDNLASYVRQFVGKVPCANPDCRFPLADDEGFYVGEYGRVCWLCHDMDIALRQTSKGVHYNTIFEWFEAAHNQWKIDRERVKKIKRGEDGPGFGGFKGFV